MNQGDTVVWVVPNYCDPESAPFTIFTGKILDKRGATNWTQYYVGNDIIPPRWVNDQHCFASTKEAEAFLLKNFRMEKQRFLNFFNKALKYLE